jgi:hypothetical protein
MRENVKWLRVYKYDEESDECVKNLTTKTFVLQDLEGCSNIAETRK